MEEESESEEEVENKEKVSKHRPSYFTPKIKFTPNEDILLLNAVQSLGIGDWHVIASRVPGRNARQCRERWNNYVNPSLIRSPWTTEEDKFLLEKYQELGPHWHTIASYFTARSTNSIKNRFTILQRRQKKKNGRKTKERKFNSRNVSFNSHHCNRRNSSSSSVTLKLSQTQNISPNNYFLDSKELTTKTTYEITPEMKQEEEYFIIDDTETKVEQQQLQKEKENKDPLQFLEFLKDYNDIFWPTDFESLAVDWFGANYM